MIIMITFYEILNADVIFVNPIQIFVFVNSVEHLFFKTDRKSSMQAHKPKIEQPTGFKIVCDFINFNK